MSVVSNHRVIVTEIAVTETSEEDSRIGLSIIFNDHSELMSKELGAIMFQSYMSR